MSIGTVIDDYLRQSGKSQRQLARDSGLTAAYIGQLIFGKLNNPSSEAIKKLAKGMAIPASELYTLVNGSEEYRQIKHLTDIGYTMVPLFAHLSGGADSFADENADEYIAVRDSWLTKGKSYFANTAFGDSMIDAGIHAGDILVFERDAALENGDIGMFTVEDKKYCKVYRKISPDTVLLESRNPKYDPIIVNPNEQDFRIIGKLVFQMGKR